MPAFRSCFDPGYTIQTEDIKCFLERAISGRRSTAVLSDRATGKTTTIVDVVASRILILPRDRKIVLAAPEKNLLDNLRRAYAQKFPFIPSPEFWNLAEGVRKGVHVDEIYVDEWFCLGCEIKRGLKEIVNPGGFVMGVGSSFEPTPILI